MKRFGSRRKRSLRRRHHRKLDRRQLKSSPLWLRCRGPPGVPLTKGLPLGLRRWHLYLAKILPRVLPRGEGTELKRRQLGARSLRRERGPRSYRPRSLKQKEKEGFGGGATKEKFIVRKVTQEEGELNFNWFFTIAFLTTSSLRILSKVQ